MGNKEIINKISSNDVSIEDLFELITDNDLDVAIAAAKSEISNEQILDIGSLDQDRRVRLAVVNNPNVGHKTLLRLSKDTDLEVSELAKTKLKG